MPRLFTCEPQKPKLASAIAVLAPVISQVYDPTSAKATPAQMEELFGPSWKANLTPTPAHEGGFTSAQQAAAKRVQIMLRDHVAQYLSERVLYASETKPVAQINALVVAVYAIVLYPDWPLHDVIVKRLQQEDEVSIRTLNCWCCHRQRLNGVSGQRYIAGFPVILPGTLFPSDYRQS